MAAGTQKWLVGIFASLTVITMYLVVDMIRMKPAADPVYSEWSPWGRCSHQCDEGRKIRRRVCLVGDFRKENQCFRLGSAEEIRPCNVAPCPVDGNFGPWSQYSGCSKECGTGEQLRRRKCDSPEPEHGGKYCIGPEYEKRECNLIECPVNGGYTDWEQWSACTDPCSTKKRIRKCEKPVPKGKGKDCSSLGNPEEVVTCDKAKCDQKEAEKKKKETDEKKKKEEEERKKKEEEEKKKKEEEEKKRKEEEEKKKKENENKATNESSDKAKKEEEEKKKKEEEEKKKKEEEEKKKKEEEEKKKKEGEEKKKKEEEEKKKKEEEEKKKKEEEEKKKKEEEEKNKKEEEEKKKKEEEEKKKKEEEEKKKKQR